MKRKGNDTRFTLVPVTVKATCNSAEDLLSTGPAAWKSSHLTNVVRSNRALTPVSQPALNRRSHTDNLLNPITFQVKPLYTQVSASMASWRLVSLSSPPTPLLVIIWVQAVTCWSQQNLDPELVKTPALNHTDRAMLNCRLFTRDAPRISVSRFLLFP